MPAHTATEAVFTATAGVTATQADAAPRTAPANRYKVTLINTHASDRLYWGTSQADAQTSTARVVEADWGEVTEFLDSNVAVWVRPSGANNIVVRILQFATA